MTTRAPAPTAADYRFDDRDRMAKFLLLSGISVQQMADLLGVGRNTVGSWINRRNNPNRATVQRWAELTGVRYQWIVDGKGSPIAAASPAQVSDLSSNGR